MSKEVVIVSAARTPIGSFNGSLAGMSAVEIGVVAAKEAIRRAGIRPDQIDEVVAGNVLGAGLGQNVIRQVAVHAGIPVEKPAFTINIVCGSGLRSVSLATQIIKAGDADVILCGGTESMTNAPYLLPNARNGHRMGDGQIVDSMIKDGLTEAFSNVHMGITAENIAERWHISREDQDRFAVTSQQRCEAAQKAGRFKDEIVPVEIPQKRGEPKIFDTDEFPRPGTTLEALAKLRPAFKKRRYRHGGQLFGYQRWCRIPHTDVGRESQRARYKAYGSHKSIRHGGLRPADNGLRTGVRYRESSEDG